MKIKTSLLILFIIISLPGFSQQPNWQWAESGHGNGQDYGMSIDVDGVGNIYATGYFEVPLVVFGQDSLTGSTNYHDNFFLVKYDNSGNELWATSAGDQNNAWGTCINTTESGTSYVSGVFQGTGTISFGNQTITSSNGNLPEVFVVKYDSTGNALWARGAGSTSEQTAYNGIDANGNVYVVANFEADSSAVKNFVKKFDTNGTLLWESTITGMYINPNITTDAAGNNYVTGTMGASTLTFGNTIVTSNNGGTMFLVKYDNAGNVLWALSDGTFPAINIPSASVDNNGNIYITGYFNGPFAQFGNIVLTNAGLDDIFIVKYDSSGNLKWAKRAGGPDYDQGHCIRTDGNGNSYLAGVFRTFTTIGNITLISYGFLDAFAAKYDSAGNVLWAQKAGGTLPDGANGIAIDADGNSYVTGYYFSPAAHFSTNTEINCDTISNPAEIFVAKLEDIPTNISNENFSETIHIVPNPFRDKTELLLGASFANISSELHVMNCLGEIVFSKSVGGSRIVIERGSLQTGLYFFEVVSRDGIRARGKMVVE